jgi:putative NADH-flavin reductase
VVDAALQRGHEVVAVVRRAGAVPARPRLTEALWTDLTDTCALASALQGADAVISALGGAQSGPTSVCTDAVRTLVPAMSTAGVQRLVAISAHGVAETHDGSLYSRAVWSRVADRMRDKESMEPLITASRSEWTLVRPPALKDSPARGGYRTGEDLSVRLWSTISRADLADFLVGEVEHPSYVRAFPRILR